MDRRRIGSRLKLAGPGVRLKVGERLRPFRLIVFADQSAEQFTRHAVELASFLDKIRHHRIGTEWLDYEQLGGSSMPIGVIQWLLALHSFARESGDTDLLSIRSGQPCAWDRTTAMTSTIWDTATVSAKLAEWILNTESTGLCPVELVDEQTPPRVLGHLQPRILNENQYAVVFELVQAFPQGVTEAKLRKATGIENPRHVLLGLMGQRPMPGKEKQTTVWTKLILNPGPLKLGWRLKPE